MSPFLLPKPSARVAYKMRAPESEVNRKVSEKYVLQIVRCVRSMMLMRKRPRMGRPPMIGKKRELVARAVDDVLARHNGSADRAGEEIGVSGATVRRIVYAGGGMSRATVALVAKAQGVTVAQLLEETS